ncbi:MAG: SpoIID/LytB domain-containing protein, partial [Anaerolineae bacterium]
MDRVRVLRSIIVVFLVMLWLGPWAGSLHSAARLVRLTTTGDIAAFEWAPRGDALVFTRPGRAIPLTPTRQQTITDLYLVATTGGGAVLLATNANLPALSLDGTRIAFVELGGDGASSLHLYDLASHQDRTLEAIDWGARPQWDRAGRLLYARQGRAQALNVGTADHHILSAQTLPANWVASPGGDRIALVSSDGLHLIGNGNDIRAFTARGGMRVQGELRWSHDGTRLAFLITQDGVDPELWMVQADGSNARRLAAGRTEYFAGVDWAPDDSNLIFTRTPTGSSISSASEIWRVQANGSRAEALTRNHTEEVAPRYSPDGRQIAFLRDGDVWVMTVDGAALPLADPTPNSPPVQEIPPAGPIPPAPHVPAAQLTPPASIRVYHDASLNSCRNEPDGQIDTLDFETYVKRVVPAEVYSTWQPEALKVQAVAARSYAWYWVLQHTAQSWDVMDSTRYQQMCDAQYASTDAAVDATRGQRGDYGWNVIFAAYSANNGDPTVQPSWNNSYLIAVDDPVDFGNAVYGNGYGMSQWGAQRWASAPYNWNYQQILMHYYTDITVESPAGSVPDTTPPIGALIAPWSNWGLTSNHAFMQASASDDASGVSQVNLNLRYTDGSGIQNIVLYPAYDGNYWTQVADASSIPDQAGIQITPSVIDGSGNTFTGNGLTLTLDRVPP